MSFRQSLLFSLLIAPLVHSDEPVQFNRDIRPILTKHCTACHGGVKEAGGISFIYREKALIEGKSGEFPIVPNDPGKSEMLRRIRSQDPEEIMPKPKHGPPLAAAEADLIERWIAQGAKWQDHWAFVPPVETAIGNLSDPAWPTMPLDGFILQKLDQQSLKPTATATPAEWLRRVSFDLTGLPPSPDDLDAFVQAHAKDPAAAKKSTVDRLLALPAFGERWASVWLDLARYSDTYGFEKDPNRDIWPYRDWVIRALNADMPYDQFTVEQLAGDLLENATADQRLATAFHRNTQTNTEDGTDDEEFRVAATIDRSTTTWTTWQATTFGCVQCHSHPYDPIEHDEFYQFLAFFNNSGDFDRIDDFPLMKVPSDPTKAAESSAMELKIGQLREQLNAAGRELTQKTAQWQPFTPDQFNPSHGTLKIAADGIIHSEGTLPVGNIHRVSADAANFTAIKINILPDSADPKKWPERGSYISRFDVKSIDPAGKATPVVMKEVFTDYYREQTEPDPGGNVGGFPKLEGPRWAVFVPLKPFTATTGSRLEISLTHKASTGGNQATPVRNFTLQLSADPGWTRIVNDPQRLALRSERLELQKTYAAIPGLMVPVMVESPPRDTRVFARGNRLSKEQSVAANVPKLLAGDAPKTTMTRLDMARWIASPTNPLTARVMVNRLWGELFGTGIVQTSEDFGTSGTPPSHPEMLDHLALRFENEHHWSIKSMLREIALSATYGQSHRATAALVERDPSNRLLARGPRNRLTAEMVRDQALSVAGVLSPKMFGTPVFPPQPAGIWSSIYNAKTWTESTGEDRFRRAIYTYHKRTSGFPGFLTFDAPSRNLCSARRITSNTPLQALVTLNDPAHIEAAQHFAQRMRDHAAELPDQLAFGIALATQQTATPAMIEELTKLQLAATADYEKTPAEAAKLADTAPAAALVLTANTILNLDSALTR
jgi:Protein of unknown function (DUF1553)/Protein of unknown function (DUF1549)/Planctomycete cytochrome C